MSYKLLNNHCSCGIQDQYVKKGWKNRLFFTDIQHLLSFQNNKAEVRKGCEAQHNFLLHCISRAYFQYWTESSCGVMLCSGSCTDAYKWTKACIVKSMLIDFVLQKSGVRCPTSKGFINFKVNGHLVSTSCFFFWNNKALRKWLLFISP